MNMRAISAAGFTAPGSVDPGAAPMLDWIPIDKLVVDESYQRPIRDQGRRNVAKIAAAFDWSKFGPVIVSPVAGGLFAIVDGQHRTTAALLAGHDKVPCCIVVADRARQAAAFAAINGAVTKVSRMAMHAAALAAGEPSALVLDDACRIANVTLLRYPVPRNLQRPGQTMAVGVVAACLARYGRDTLITALQCVTETDNNQAGVLTGPMVKALCELLHARREWRDAGDALLQAMDRTPLAELEEEARTEAARQRGKTTGTILVELLTERLSELMGPPREIAA